MPGRAKNTFIDSSSAHQKYILMNSCRLSSIVSKLPFGVATVTTVTHHTVSVIHQSTSPLSTHLLSSSDPLIIIILDRTTKILIRYFQLKYFCRAHSIAFDPINGTKRNENGEKNGSTVKTNKRIWCDETDKIDKHEHNLDVRIELVAQCTHTQYAHVFSIHPLTCARWMSV